jgi:hypothetical protein
MSKRMRAKLSEVNDELKRRRHEPIPVQGGGWPVWCEGTRPTSTTWLRRCCRFATRAASQVAPISRAAMRPTTGNALACVTARCGNEDERAGDTTDHDNEHKQQEGSSTGLT